MTDEKCLHCGGRLEHGFVSTTNGSGLFWAHSATSTRLRPKGLEVLVPTQFMGTYSANIPGTRCTSCERLELHLKKVPMPGAPTD